MPWDPDRYLLFREERYAPFADLLALINVRPGLRVIDLGCGGRRADPPAGRCLARQRCARH